MGKDEDYDSETWKTKMVFWFMQFLYTIGTIIPGYLVYHNYYLNLIWLFYVMAMIVWNGASFYIEVFAVRYSLQFTGKDESVDVPDADTPPPRESKPTKSESGDKKNE